MITKPAVFYFSFVDEEKETDFKEADFEVRYAFNISEKGVAKIEAACSDTFDQWTCTGLIEYAEEMEKYGVHDWSSSPDDRVYGIGYSTYEITSEKIQSVMKEWREIFISLVGAENVSLVVKVSAEGYDYEVYQEVLNSSSGVYRP